jgi:hypothetical protein
MVRVSQTFRAYREREEPALVTHEQGRPEPRRTPAHTSKRAPRAISLAAAIVVLGLPAAGCGGSGGIKWTDDDAAWSPNGRTIAFVSNRAHPGSERFQLYVMRADGSSVRKLTRGRAVYPSYSPDGRSIVSSDDSNDYHWAI